jgi:hypothetical protein
MADVIDFDEKRFDEIGPMGWTPEQMLRWALKKFADPNAELCNQKAILITFDTDEEGGVEISKMYSQCSFLELQGALSTAHYDLCKNNEA